MEAFLQTLLTMSATAAVVALVVMVLRLPLKRSHGGSPVPCGGWCCCGWSCRPACPCR